MKALNQIWAYKNLRPNTEFQEANHIKIKANHGDDGVLPLVAHGDKDYIGMEVEVEGITRPYVMDYINDLWMADRDGSLKDNGQEFQSYPALPLYAMSMLQGLKITLDKSNPNHYFGKRSSFHYHINVRDLTPHQLATYILMYSTVEFLMFEMTKAERMVSNFCVPINDTECVFNSIRYLIDTGEAIRVNDLVQFYGGKYAALGLFRLHDLGTVEFRHLHGNLDLPLLRRWISVGLRLKHAARKYSLDWMQTTLSSLNTHSRYAEYVKTITEDSFDPVIHACDARHMSEAVANAKSVFCKNIDIRILNVINSPLGRKIIEEKEQA